MGGARLGCGFVLAPLSAAATSAYGWLLPLLFVAAFFTLRRLVRVAKTSVAQCQQPTCLEQEALTAYGKAHRTNRAARAEIQKSPAQHKKRPQVDVKVYKGFTEHA